MLVLQIGNKQRGAERSHIDIANYSVKVGIVYIAYLGSLWAVHRSNMEIVKASDFKLVKTNSPKNRHLFCV